MRAPCMPEQQRFSASAELWDTAVEWLLALNDNPDDAALRTALQRWLGEDAAHRQAFREAVDLWGLTGRLDPAYAHWWREEPAPHTAGAPPIREPESEPAPVTARPARRWWVSGALAACLCIALLPWLYTRLGVDFRTAPGQNRELILEDRSAVYLSGDSALDVDFSPALRTVALLRGEAFFAVSANKERPFVVQVGSARVRVVGTRFNVRSRGDELQVDVEEGHVVVEERDDAAALQLFAGDSVLIERGPTPSLRRARVPLEQIAAWRRGQLIVEDWPVAKVLDELGHHRRGVVIVLDDGLARETVSGVFNLARPDDALRALMQPFGGRVREYGPYLATVSAR